MASSLRSFRAEDRPAVLELSRHALQQPREQVGNPIWTTEEELVSELSDWEADPAETLMVDEQDGDVIGFGGVEVSAGWEHADLFGPLVSPAYRGQKLGTVLLEASIERASAMMPGTAAIDVYVRIYELFQKGRRAEAKALFYRLLPYLTFALQHLEVAIWIEKRLLVKRGVIPEARMRRPTIFLDEEYEKQMEELTDEVHALSAECQKK